MTGSYKKEEPLVCRRKYRMICHTDKYRLSQSQLKQLVRDTIIEEEDFKDLKESRPIFNCFI